MVIPFQELTIANQLQILTSQLKQKQYQQRDDNENDDNALMMNTIWKYPVKLSDHLRQLYIKHIGENIIHHTPSPALGDTIMISIANEGNGHIIITILF